MLFRSFWGKRFSDNEDEPQLLSPAEEPLRGDSPDNTGVEELFEQALGEESGENKEDGELPGYSRVEVLRKKDFSRLDMEESQAMSKAILKIAQKIATRVSRRKVRSRRGAEVDLRGTFRRNMKYGGEVLELDRRKRRIKKDRKSVV